MILIVLVHLIFFLHLAFPCAFSLLPSRSKNTYKFLFDELKSLAAQMKLNFTPKMIMSDFEPTMIVVLKSETSVLDFL